MRRLAALLTALVTLSACSGGPRVAAPPPPPIAALPPPPRAMEPVPPPPAPVVVAPEAQPQAPRGTVQARAFYAEADVTEWVLATGATVVFKPLPNGGSVELLGVAPSLGTACEARTTSSRTSGDLAGLFETSLGPRAVYVVVGDARPGEVEQAAARLLTLRPADGPCAAAAGGRTVQTAADEAAEVAVLVEVLRARGEMAFARTSGGQTTLGGAPGTLAALRPTDAELAAARSAAARRPEAAAFWLDALASLYTSPGDVRPPRDPAVVARFPARVARVSSRAVADLAARFAASPAAPPAN